MSNPVPENAGMLSAHFSRREFACRDGCGTVYVDRRLLTALEELRTRVGRPVVIQSGCRCSYHNTHERGHRHSYHLTIDGRCPCRAADLRVAGLSLRELFQAALEVEAFRRGGLGVYPQGNFLHADVRGRRARWSRLDGRYQALPTGFAELEAEFAS